MALINTNTPGKHFRILLWKIEESVDELQRNVRLGSEEEIKYRQISHPDKQKEFLALRQCLLSHFGNCPEVKYTPEGKPYLSNGPYISFSHTQQHAAVIISERLPVGIDLEFHRDGIQRIAQKFLRAEESHTLDPQNRTAHITAYWGAKEVIVKISGDRRLNFRQQIRIRPFLYSPELHTTARLHQRGDSTAYSLYFKALPSLYLTFGWQIS